MAVTFACEKCHAEYTVADSLAGKKGRCNACGHLMQVPAMKRAPAAATTPHGRSAASSSTAAARAINFADPLDADARDIPAARPASTKRAARRTAQTDPNDPLAALESVADVEDDGTIPFADGFQSRGGISLNFGGPASTVCLMLGVVACLLPLLNQPIINAYGRIPVYTGLALGLIGAFILVQKGRGTAGVVAGAIIVAAFFGGVMYKPANPADKPVVRNATPSRQTPRTAGSGKVPRTTLDAPANAPLRTQLQNLNSFDSAARLAAAQEILKSPPPDRLADVVRAMEPKLIEDNPRLRRLAIQGVMLQPTAHTPSMLAHLVEDRDQSVRESALRALGMLGGPIAVRAIASRLADDPTVAREALAAAQGSDPRLAIDAFKQLLAESRDPRLRAIAIDELAERNSPDGEAFVSLIDDPDPRVSEAAMRAVGKLKVSSGIRPIVDKLGESEAAVAALQSFGPAAERDVLMVANSPNKLIRAAAARVLITAATPQNLPVVQRLARDENSDVAAAALEAWKRLVPEDFTPVKEAIRDLESAHVLRQRAGIEKLLKIEPDEHRSRVATALLAVALGDEVDLRIPAADALAVWGTRDALLMLVQALDNPDTLVQARAKEVLGHLKDPRAVDPLADLAEKGNTTAVEALAAMGPIAEDGALRLLNCTDPAVQLAAVRALGEIGTRRSVLPLGALMRSRPDHAARFEDREALRKINLRITGQTREEARKRIKTVPTTQTER